jgi:serine/threonine protein kinase
VRARNIQSKRDVAVKVAWNDASGRTRVLRETVLTAKVAHPSVLAPRDIPAPEPMLVIEMPLALGGTLSDLLEAGKPVPFATVLEIVRAGAAALDQAQSAGIIHGGLRPVKILLDEAGKALVSDFAIRIPRRADWDVSRTSEVGAQAYMPLEQRHESESIDGRVDQYALAIIAYELLRGQATWRINDEGVMEVDATEIMVHRAIAPGAPLSASMAIKRATAKDPVFRYASAGAFVRAFAGETVDVVAKEHIHRAEVTVQQHRSRAWVLLPLVLVVSALALRPSLRDEAIGLWDHWSFGGGKDFGSSDITPAAPAYQSGSTPASASNAQSSRRDSSLGPNNTRVGEQTNTSTRPAGSGGPAINIFPKNGGAPNTRQADASPTNSNTKRPGNSSPSVTPSLPTGSGPSRSNAARRADGGEITAAAKNQSESAAPAGEGVMVVTLDADARAVVVVDGRPRGQTPLTLRVSAGKHEVSLRGIEGLSPTPRTITLAAGDTVRTAFSPKARP